jgi:N-acetyl-anhydromuramyl-L-alanine amidase AmpD
MNNKKSHALQSWQYLFMAIACGLLLAADCAAKTSCNNDIEINQKLIVFDKERIALTKQYRYEHYGIKSESIVIEPQMIVLHWTCSKTLQSAYDTFEYATLDSRPDIKKNGNLNVSSHFLVDRNGKIYQLMPTNWMARHTIGLNNIAIGIENIGGVGDREDLTAAQVAANVQLVRHLKTQYPNIIHLIGHYEYGEFRGTNLWQEKDSNYFTNKTDPGKKFMRAVRKALGCSQKMKINNCKALPIRC